MTTETKTPQKCKVVTYEITLPKGVEAAWVTMAGKLYYLDDTTGEAIAERGVSAPTQKLTAIWLGWYDKKWVYGVSWDNGDEDQIEYDGALPLIPTLTQLEAAVVSVAWEHGVEIREDQVTVDVGKCDFLSPGGNIYANWKSECTTPN